MHHFKWIDRESSYITTFLMVDLFTFLVDVLSIPTRNMGVLWLWLQPNIITQTTIDTSFHHMPFAMSSVSHQGYALPLPFSNQFILPNETMFHVPIMAFKFTCAYSSYLRFIIISKKTHRFLFSYQLLDMSSCNHYQSIMKLERSD